MCPSVFARRSLAARSQREARKLLTKIKQKPELAVGISAKGLPAHITLYKYYATTANGRVLPTADQVKVKSGRTVTIFNITNHYRLITAIHYNHEIVYILLLLTPNAYDQGHWKNNL